MPSKKRKPGANKTRFEFQQVMAPLQAARPALQPPPRAQQGPGVQQPCGPRGRTLFEALLETPCFVLGT